MDSNGVLWSGICTGHLLWLVVITYYRAEVQTFLRLQQ